jgi:hypothetical protein
VFLDSETKRLHVPSKLGARLKVKQHRPLEGTPKTAHLVLRADGHWYVLIVCDIGDATQKRKGDAIKIARRRKDHAHKSRAFPEKVTAKAIRVITLSGPPSRGSRRRRG